MRGTTANGLLLKRILCNRGDRARENGNVGKTNQTMRILLARIQESREERGSTPGLRRMNFSWQVVKRSLIIAGIMVVRTVVSIRSNCDPLKFALNNVSLSADRFSMTVTFAATINDPFIQLLRPPARSFSFPLSQFPFQ